MCRIWLRQVCVCAGAWGADGVCAIPHTLPTPSPVDPWFPYREVYFARVVPQYWMFLLKISRRALFFFHLETYTGNVLGQLTHTHTHTWRQTFFLHPSGDGRQRGGTGGKGQVATTPQICHSSLFQRRSLFRQAHFQFETSPACLPPRNLQPVTANNATT